MAIDGEVFKQLAGSWASGVTVVTSRHGDRQQGMTVSAFTEVSLDPPLFLVCADKSSITNELIAASGVFTVSILAQDQDAVSNKFASKKEEHVRFVGLECEDGKTGCPRIPGALGWIDCVVDQTVDAGDHFIYIGRAEAADATDRAPLVYFRQAYRRIG